MYRWHIDPVKIGKVRSWLVFVLVQPRTVYSVMLLGWLIDASGATDPKRSS